MSRRDLSFTEPLRARLPDRFQDLPQRINASASVVNGVAQTAGFSTHNSWKQSFARFKTAAAGGLHGKRGGRRGGLADAIMLGAAAKRSGNSDKAARMMLAAGVIEDNRNHFKKASRYYAKAAALFRELGDYRAEALTYNYASISSFLAEDHDRCRSFCRKQRRVHIQNQKMAEDHFLVSVSNEGLSYRKSGDFAKAEKCHQRLLQGQNYSPSRMQAESLANGHLAMSLLGQLTMPSQTGHNAGRHDEVKTRRRNNFLIDQGIEALQRSRNLTLTISQSNDASPQRLRPGRPPHQSNILFDQ